MRDLILIAGVLLGALYAIRNPAFGYLAFVGTSLFNPHTMTWGVARSFPFAMILAVGTLIGFAFWPERGRFRFRREGTLLLILWGWLVLTSTFADYPDRAWEKLIDVSKILLLPIVSIAIITTKARLHGLMRTIGIALGLYGLNAGFFVVVTGGNYMVWGPEGTFLGANNAIGLALVMNLPILRYLASVETRTWLRRLYWLMLLLSYPAIVATYSRGAWLAMATATGLMILKSRYRVIVAVATIVVFLLVLPYLPERAFNRYDDLANYENEGSAQSRFWNWRFATHVMKANPVFGAGFRYYGIPAYQKYFPEFLVAWPGKTWSCHSIWFTMLSEHGIPGASLFVGLLFTAVWNTFRISRLAKRDERAKWAMPFSDAIQISLLSYMVSGTFYDAAFFDLMYTLLIAVVCIQNIIETAPDGTEPQGAKSMSTARAWRLRRSDRVGISSRRAVPATGGHVRSATAVGCDSGSSRSSQGIA